jgi:hypothetical protein
MLSYVHSKGKGMCASSGATLGVGNQSFAGLKLVIFGNLVRHLLTKRSPMSVFRELQQPILSSMYNQLSLS